MSLLVRCDGCEGGQGATPAVVERAWLTVSGRHNPMLDGRPFAGQLHFHGWDCVATFAARMVARSA